MAAYSRDLSQVQQKERSVQDNFKFRRVLREIKEKDRIVSELNSRQEAFDGELYRAKSREYVERQSQLTGQRAGLEGEVRQLRDQKAGLAKDLRTDYNDVEDRFYDQYLKVKV